MTKRTKTPKPMSFSECERALTPLMPTAYSWFLAVTHARYHFDGSSRVQWDVKCAGIDLWVDAKTPEELVMMVKARLQAGPSKAMATKDVAL